MLERDSAGIGFNTGTKVVRMIDLSPAKLPPTLESPPSSSPSPRPPIGKRIGPKILNLHKEKQRAAEQRQQREQRRRKSSGGKQNLDPHHRMAARLPSGTWSRSASIWLGRRRQVSNIIAR